jgi:hypothetical protein
VGQWLVEGKDSSQVVLLSKGEREREREREAITNKDANHNSDAPFSKCKACVPADPKFKFC